MPELPPPRDQRRSYRIATVCLGNICRSPMAEVVLSAALEDAGLDDRVEVDSSGTGGWHTGEPMDDRAAETLGAHGYDPSRHRAQQFDTSWFDEYDLILTMDHANDRDVRALAPSDGDAQRVQMFRAYDPEASASDDEVPDPWYGGQDGFERVLAMVERTTKALVDALDARV
ncbi:low molecular weight protein-tyrosine-phosphatase [Solicola gregarius]|uniref:protein-tyrosine-phosphatase n=1 Tax=Solicola gregarius TaxID=2908642 RepID=A0AA46YLY3_9ACTN|nr:low molecular weight protein-tyrosine-phosphatase [Solicola gregarius]UYM07152.1 low molecular weight phosphotyrosine protein phosphatase [Solicola gregarius]